MKNYKKLVQLHFFYVISRYCFVNVKMRQKKTVEADSYHLDIIAKEIFNKQEFHRESFHSDY